MVQFPLNTAHCSFKHPQYVLECDKMYSLYFVPQPQRIIHPSGADREVVTVQVTPKAERLTVGKKKVK